MSPSDPPVPAPRKPRPGPSHRAYLMVLAGPQFGEMFRLEPRRELEIGRRPESDVFVQDAGVSRRHATICVDEKGAVIRDAGSRNGTFVDGHARPSARVLDGSRIQIGASTTMRFAMSDAMEAEFQRRLADAALRDPLTGLQNRGKFAERLGAEVAAFRLHERPLALIALDIDFFKRVNDQHGHLAGDQVLKTVATALRNAARVDDVVARWGGEEFVVLARDTGLSGARALAERVRLAVASASTRWSNLDLRVTVSVGFSVLSAARRATDAGPEQALLEAADRALYRAKERGRNRVEGDEAGP